MRVLLIGGGGREHALCWKLSQSAIIGQLFTLPGNPGTASVPKNENVSIALEDIEAQVAFASTEGIDLTVVGPEKPLAMGITDLFIKRGLRIFGPTQAAAKLESSKTFAKEVMLAAGVPTAAYEVFTDRNALHEFLKTARYPVVLKEDGLAAGKGVAVCASQDIASEFAQRTFEKENQRVVAEEFLEGEEISFFVACDGVSFVPMKSAQDHKRLLDGDLGPNTGGMGAYSPANGFTPALQRVVEEKIVTPVLAEMAKRGTPFSGLLFVGLMMTKDGPKVLEFNARYGDPETEAMLPILETDLLELFDRTTRNRLDGFSLNWKNESSLTVVLTSEGYPASPRKGDVITLPEDIPDSVIVFHAGTKTVDGKLVTDGGRIFAVTGVGPTLKDAAQNAYAVADRIQYAGKHFRRDIGWRALSNEHG